jgi:hypothetical protein
MRRFAATLALIHIMTFLAGSLPAQEAGAPPDAKLRKHNFDGYIEWMPQVGYVGEWVIGGHRVHVTSRTEIHTKHGAPGVGVMVHVNAMGYRGQLVATKIRVKKPKGQ